jgi:ABC-type phosphate transport system substrate-binding protein
MTRVVLGLFAFTASCSGQLNDPDVIKIDGTGTTNPSIFFWQIMERFRARSRADFEMTYRAVGSSTGQKEFSQVTSGDYSSSLTDFGAGDIPMDATSYASIVGAGRKMIHVPFSLGAIGIFHSVPVSEVGTDGLKLTPCLLAKIFSGQITSWDHADIVAQNPNLQVPSGQKIIVGHRIYGSSSTGGTTGYLNSKCPNDWKNIDGGAAMGEGSTVTWPVTTSGVDWDFRPVEGSGGMKSLIAGTKYAIGYLDAGHGHQRNFQEISLQNEDGTFLTSKESMAQNGITAAAANVGTLPSADGDWSNVNLYSKTGQHTWPIVLISYMYVHENMQAWSSDKVGLFKAFVDYVLSVEGQTLVTKYGFAKVPSSMNTWQATWTTLIQKPVNVTDFSFESSTEAWAGQAITKISTKRDTYNHWKIEELRVALQAATARIEKLESHLDDYGIVPLHGSGTTNPKNWFAKAMLLLEHRSRAPLLLTYRAVGSSTGQKEFVGQTSNNYQSYNHFGAGDIPMPSDMFQTLTLAAEHMVHLPFALGAIGIFHSVPSDKRGGEDLKLDACTLAKIFDGGITTWDHADIKSQNPNMNVAAGTKIKVGHRTLGSSSTGGVTSYLKKSCPTVWTKEAGATIVWPAAPAFDNFYAVQGSPGMQAHIEGQDYAIGYLDAGHGHDVGLAEVALKNKAGISLTSKTAMASTPNGIAAAGAEGVSSGAFPSDAAGDWSAVNLYDMAGDTTWPIVLVSYLYVKKDQTQTNVKTAAALKAFIEMILNDNDNLAAEFGFTSPPTSLKSNTAAAAATIVYPPGMVPFAFELATTPYTGMSSAMISSMRHEYGDYDRGLLEGRIQKIETKQAEAAAVVAPVQQVAHDDGHADNALIISIVALAVAVVGQFVSFGVMSMRSRKVPNASLGQSHPIGNSA